MRRSHVEMRSRRYIATQYVSDLDEQKPSKLPPPPREKNAMHEKLMQLREQLR